MATIHSLPAELLYRILEFGSPSFTDLEACNERNSSSRTRSGPPLPQDVFPATFFSIFPISSSTRFPPLQSSPPFSDPLSGPSDSSSAKTSSSHTTSPPSPMSPPTSPLSTSLRRWKKPPCAPSSSPARASTTSDWSQESPPGPSLSSPTLFKSSRSNAWLASTPRSSK